MKHLKRALALALALIMFAGVVTVYTIPGYAKGKKNQAKTTVDANYCQSAACYILDANTLAFKAVLPAVTQSDDNVLYLYQLQTYEYTVNPAAAPIATAAMQTTPTFTFALNHHQADTRLYSKFVLCIKKGGAIVPISNPQYITNPEVLATHTHARTPHGKKGLIGQDASNLYLDAPNQLAPSQCPRVIAVLNNGCNQVITNPYGRAPYQLTDSHPGIVSYYMLNANDAAGVSALVKKMEKYGAEAARTDDWVIGNEVNVRQWNYMTWISWEEYMRQYEQVFRICYTAIKSQNANANVYICLDQNWDRNRPASHKEYFEYIDGKDFLTMFNSDISKSGNIDWGVSQHPYPVPLTYAKVWDMSGCPDGAYCANQVNSGKMISFQNLSIITNFLTKANMLSPKGTVRHFMCNELSITNGQGGQVQAAAIYASYYAAATNPYVEQILYSSANHGSFDSTFTPEGLDMFNNMDGANGAAYQALALQIMGKTSMGQVVK